MSIFKNWEGNDECVLMSSRVATSFETESVLSINESRKIEANNNDSPDKTDYLVAFSCGLITGLLDIFWVGSFSLDQAQTWGREKINGFIVKVAQLQDYKKDDLEGAIRHLEKKNPIPSDVLAPSFGGGLQHHLRDFAHHPTIAGLFFSLLTQFSGKSYGTNINGDFIIQPVPDQKYIGKNFVEKVYNGSVIWAFHLISDMAGSSNNPGKGTGIPGPLLSCIKEISVLPYVKNITMELKNNETNLSVIISKLFNGTFISHDNKEAIRFDLRTEIGVFAHLTKQTIPVVINKCLVRAFYAIRRFFREINVHKISKISDFSRISYAAFIPKNNKCIIRMSTISCGTFTALDFGGATIKSVMKGSHDKSSLMTSLLFNLNFIGIANFVIAIKQDIKNAEKSLNDISIQELISNCQLALQSNNKENDMYYNDLYDYSFSWLKAKTKDLVSTLNVKIEYPNETLIPVFTTTDPITREYNMIYNSLDRIILEETVRLIMRMMRKGNIDYISTQDNLYNRNEIPFKQIIDNEVIGYVFSDSIAEYVADYFDDYKVDKIIVVSLNEVMDKEKYERDMSIQNNTLNSKNVVQITLRDFFKEFFGENEYTNYKKYVADFNKYVIDTIGYSTGKIATVPVLNEFKKKRLSVLSNKSFFDKYLSSSVLSKESREVINKNYYEKKRYLAMIGNSDFADSFISSEWYRETHYAPSSLERTAIVAGYFKSIEQLLYSLVSTMIDTGKHIGKKEIEFTSQNLNKINTSFGSLIYFIRNNKECWDIPSRDIDSITYKLYIYKKQYRNDHFHKDNLYDEERIEEIRNNTLLVYYYLLGSFHIDTDKENILKPPTDLCLKNKRFDIDSFLSWLDRLLKGDPFIEFNKWLEIVINMNTIQVNVRPEEPTANKSSSETSKIIDQYSFEPLQLFDDSSTLQPYEKGALIKQSIFDDIVSGIKKHVVSHSLSKFTGFVITDFENYYFSDDNT